MSDFVMRVYKSYDSENPHTIHYAGDKAGAIDYALGEHAFEVDIYEGRRIGPESRSVCVVMYGGNVLMEEE